MTEQKYFRKGFKMRENVQHLLDRDYRSEVVNRVRENGNVFEAEGLTIRLADEFGFCYGVDRAVDYAFQTREKFPTGALHQGTFPTASRRRLREMGMSSLTASKAPPRRLSKISPPRFVSYPPSAPHRLGREAEHKECVVVTRLRFVTSYGTSHALRQGGLPASPRNYYHEETGTHRRPLGMAQR